MSASLLWTLLEVARRREVHCRTRLEVSERLGQSRVRFADTALLPYTVAALLEVERFTCPMPLSLPRRATRFVSVKGYGVPEGARVVANVYTAHRAWDTNGDPTCDQKEQVFDPERHFAHRTSTGALEVSPESVARLLSGGWGVRTCVGHVAASPMSKFGLAFDGGTSKSDGSTGTNILGGVTAFGLGVERLLVFLFVTVLLQRVQLALDDRSPLPPTDEGILRGPVRWPKPFSLIFTK